MGGVGPIVIAAGGTGGHTFPAQSLARELHSRGRDVVLVTDTRGEDYAKSFPGTAIERVRAATFGSKNPLSILKALNQIRLGMRDAKALFARIKPEAVVGFGGYPSLPAMLGAWRMKLPAIIHEQNAVPGRVNRLMVSRVSKIASSFPVLKGVAPERLIVTGNPVRENVVAARAVPYAAPETGGRIRLLVFGGSQGARIMSDIVPPAIAALSADLRARLSVVQQARAEDVARTKEIYAKAGVEAEVAAFFNDLPQRLSSAHLVISRSGASTVAELTCAGRPAILVPYPFATDDHQTANASVLAEAGAALMVPQPQFLSANLSSALSALLGDSARLSAMARAAHALGRPDAAKLLADAVLALADRGPTP